MDTNWKTVLALRIGLVQRSPSPVNVANYVEPKDEVVNIEGAHVMCSNVFIQLMPEGAIVVAIVTEEKLPRWLKQQPVWQEMKGTYACVLTL